MRRLIIKFIFLISLVASTYISILYSIFFHTEYLDHTDYMSSIHDKIKLVKSTLSPKIIFIGGSNLAFGLNSAEIQKQLGFPVVNLALHANIGLQYMMDSVKPYISRNDIIVVIPEYEQFYGTYYGQSELLKYLHTYPVGWRYVNWPQQYLNILKYSNLLIRKMLFSKIDNTPKAGGIYTRKAFNSYGDVTSHLSESETDQIIKSKSVNRTRIFKNCPGFNDNAILGLEAFQSYVNSRDAKFVFLFPVRKDSAYQQLYAQHLTVYLKIKESDIEFYSNPSDWIFPDSYFFDSDYHLNAFGRQVRTEKVIKELRKYLKDDPVFYRKHGISRQPFEFTILTSLFPNLLRCGNESKKIHSIGVKEQSYYFYANLISTKFTNAGIEGIRDPEGPYPQWNLPKVRWIDKSCAKINFKIEDRSRVIKLTMSFRPQVRSSAKMLILFNKKALKTYHLTDAENWYTDILYFIAQKGLNTIEFLNEPILGETSPPSSLFMLFKALSLEEI